MGFCGVDDSVSPQLLADLSVFYDWIEWGILFRTDLEGQPRYASWKWVEKLCEIQKESGNKLNLAGHLCADRCQEILAGDHTFVQKLGNMGFKRVQINATAANSVVVDGSLIQNYVENLKACIRAVPDVEWIIQWNDETEPIWRSLTTECEPLANASLLFDASCGKGVLVTSFPEPTRFPTFRCGYAGGIGPSTISSVMVNLKELAKDHNATVWIDMESSLRALLLDGPVSDSTAVKDVFSIEKCYVCVERAVELGMPRRAPSSF